MEAKISLMAIRMYLVRFFKSMNEEEIRRRDSRSRLDPDVERSNNGIPGTIHACRRRVMTWVGLSDEMKNDKLHCKRTEFAGAPIERHSDKK